MNIDSSTIDRIVAGVLNQLAGGRDGALTRVTAETRSHGGRAEGGAIEASVVTAEALLAHLDGRSRIVVSNKAIVTPAAWDAAKARGVEIMRQGGQAVSSWSSAPSGDQRLPSNTFHGAHSESLCSLLVVVKNTEAVVRLWDDVNSSWKQELLGCPDEAAALAISAICRGDAQTVVLMVEQRHRSACRANRNERIKAVAIQDAGDVRAIRKQLRANVWCIDPTGRSWFELRNLLRTITGQ